MGCKFLVFCVELRFVIFFFNEEVEDFFEKFLLYENNFEKK